MKAGAAKAVADVGAGRILARVEIASTPERVFRALTEEVTAWWGSPDWYRTTAWEADLRVGGKWKSTGVGSDGVTFFVSGEYLEVDPPRALVHTWEAPWDGGKTTVVRYRLDPIEGGTRVTLIHEGFAGRAESCDGHAEGWERVLDWLSDHVAPTAPRQAFLCKLIAPRATFPADITPEEGSLMAEHAAYCKTLLRGGEGVVFGPVADADRTWGAGVLRVTDAARAKAITDADPIVRSGRGFRYEISPMLGLIT